MEIEQAFEKVAPGTRNVGKFQYLIYSCVCLVQILLACQMCLLVVLEPYLTQPESRFIQELKGFKFSLLLNGISIISDYGDYKYPPY